MVDVQQATSHSAEAEPGPCPGLGQLPPVFGSGPEPPMTIPGLTFLRSGPPPTQTACVCVCVYFDQLCDLIDIGLLWTFEGES